VAKYLYPSSFECDCGHQADFFENTISHMETESRRRKKPITLTDSDDRHSIEFSGGKATAVECPDRGRCHIAN
jgi:hypothetical protein